MQPQWVTAATFELPYQAHLAKARLEAEGIPVFIQDEHLIGINPLYSPVVGGVKVQVPDVHLSQALKVLVSAPDVPLSDEEVLRAEIPAEPKPEASELMECPRCGGRGFIEPIDNTLQRWVNTLLLGLPWIVLGRPVVCRACGHTFRRPA